MPVEPLPSASVVLVRPADCGWETFLLQRNRASRAFPGAWVFPGGTLQPQDRWNEPSLSLGLTLVEAQAALSRAMDTPAPSPDDSLAYFVCAARELLEETGVVLFTSDIPGGADKASLKFDGPLRYQPLSAIAASLSGEGFRLALDQLVYYAHWITPEALPQRFDTRFFLSVLPPYQFPRPDGWELVDAVWIEPAEAIERTRAGTLTPHFATLQHLKRMAPYATLDELLEFARAKPVIPVLPPTREENGRHVPMIPSEIDGIW